MKNSHTKDFGAVIKAIKQNVSSLRFGQDNGLEPDRNGYCRCIFHSDSNPSMKLYDGERGFYCFSCHAHGDVLDLVQQLSPGMDLAGAVRALDRAYSLHLTDGEGAEDLVLKARQYAQQRKLNRELAQNALQAVQNALQDVSDRVDELEAKAAKDAPQDPSEGFPDDFGETLAALENAKAWKADLINREFEMQNAAKDTDTPAAQTVIQFTEEQIMDTPDPYVYLYGISDPFVQQREYERILAYAKTVSRECRAAFVRMWKSYVKSQGADKKTYDAVNVTSFPNQDIVLRCGEYQCDEHGVSYYHPLAGSVTVCPHPILPSRRIVNIDSGEHKTEIAFLRGNVWRSAIFQNTTIASAQKIVQLASWGVAVDSETAKALVTYLNYISSENYDALPEKKSVGRLGWVEGYGFSPYIDELLFDGQEQYRHAFEAVRSQGDRDKWMKVARAVRQGKSVAARMMLAASFASALVSPLNALPFMLHCWSNVSGIGKTVALMLAGSVWADPRQGEYIKTFNSTSVGIEMMAAFCGSLPLCLDELCLKNGKREAFDDMIYGYCEGVGRTRGSRTGGIQKTTAWRNCAISTGEEPLTSARSKAGAINRVLDVNAGDVNMFEDPRTTVAILNANYGFAGREFIETVTPETIDEIREIQLDFQRRMEGQTTDKQSLSASLVLTADTWAERHIFRDGVRLTVEDILPSLTTPESVDVNRRCYEWLLDTINANPSKFEVRDDGTYAGECWGETDWVKGRAWIIKSTFDRLLDGEGFNPTGFLNWAKFKHRIIPGNGHNTVMKRLTGQNGIARCVCLVLDAEEDNEDDGKDRKPDEPKRFAEAEIDIPW